MERLHSGYEDIVPGMYAILTVQDSGTGIDPADIDKIFEPYYSKKKMGTSGSGLGLSVVYGVVKDHKGYYDVLSELGKGTAFVLYFPVSTVAAEIKQQNLIDLKGTETVLVVDDDPGQCEIASELLSSYGYRVSTAANGHEALDLLTKESIDIVVLDMIMEKGFDGLDTYREIIKARPGQKAIIISGFSPTERVEEMQGLGAGQYVRKPYTRQSLATAIRGELSRPAGTVLTEVLPTKMHV
jgi:CheY-like chemotaxis protein